MTTLVPNNDFGPSVFRPFSWPSKHAIRNDKFIARDDTTSIQQLIWKGTAMTAKKIATQNNVEALIAAANEEKITVPTQTTTEPVETPAAVIEEDVVDASENTEDEDSNGKISVTGKLKGFLRKHKKKVVVTTLVIALVGAVAGTLSQDSETEDDEDNNENDSAEGNESSED